MWKLRTVPKTLKTLCLSVFSDLWLYFHPFSQGKALSSLSVSQPRSAELSHWWGGPRKLGSGVWLWPGPNQGMNTCHATLCNVLWVWGATADVRSCSFPVFVVWCQNVQINSTVPMVLAWQWFITFLWANEQFCIVYVFILLLLNSNQTLVYLGHKEKYKFICEKHIFFSFRTTPRKWCYLLFFELRLPSC